MYRRELLTCKIPLEFVHVGNSTKRNLERWVQQEMEGRCSVEGFIRPNSTNVLTYSSGRIVGHRVLFDVGFECQVCTPVEGHMITCIVENATKAGVRAKMKTRDDEPSPVDVFCARDHHHDNSYFLSLKEGDEITVRVIGQRYELNDPMISVIAQVLHPDRVKKD